MGATDSFRQHHRELLKLSAQMSKLLAPVQVRKDPGMVRAMLARFSGKLSIHLVMEDSSLYPALVNHGDKAVRSIAGRLAKETGDLKDVFSSYTEKWPSAEAIQSNASAFIRETRNIFYALSKRIEKEDTELYELMEKTKTAA